ncbi:fimbrial protein [Enterobacter wuhouensis]|uniref:fimbrial protein n=1 Tax=Enterobacter wuhouensis TaxID=2529381 RepID=UPI002FD5ACA7
MLVIRFALLLLSLLFPLCGYSCTYTFIGSPYTVDYGNIIVQRDVPVGQAISNEIYGSMAHAFSCLTTGTEGSSAGMKSSMLSYAFTSSTGRRVYNTNLPGVGISFGYAKNTLAGTAVFGGKNYLTSSDISTVSWSSNPNEVDSNDYQPIIQFWKTGNITSGSVMGQLASFIAYTAQYNGGQLAGDIPVYAGAGTITQVACTIKSASMVFDLGDVLEDVFGNTVGATPAQAQNTQNLILDCDSGANINVTLSGVQNPDVSNTSVLGLTGQGNAGVASGVGVQLIYNSTPLALNTNIVLKNSAGGIEMFPLTARYYQTKTAVTTGTANASATLTLTYQ